MKGKKNYSNRKLILDLLIHFSPKRKKQLVLLLLLVLLSAVSEILSLAAFIPFLAVLSDSQELLKNPKIFAITNFFELNDLNQILFFTTTIFILCILITVTIRLSSLWLSGRMAALLGSDLSCEVYRKTLYQPYIVHIQRSSSEVINTTTNQINITMAVIRNLLQFINGLIISTSLFVGMLFINWRIAISSAFIFGFAYLMLGLTANRRLSNNSQIVSKASEKQVKSLQEGLGAIRDVLMNNTQKTFTSIYEHYDKRMRKTQYESQFLTSFPRYSLEGLGLILMSLIALSLSINNDKNNEVIPILGSLALAAQRILPTLQLTYSGWASIKSNNQSVQNVINLLNQVEEIPPKILSSDKKRNFKNIRFSNVYYKYPSRKQNVLNNLNFTIKKGEKIGIVGVTGSGKSTLTDMMMGLLKPSIGNIYVDGIDIHKDKNSYANAFWRSKIANVPQRIFLTDNSIYENIALGERLEDIDMKRVREVSKQAQIIDLIRSLPNGFNTFVGERGIKLSVGQAQRIGIARALYKNAKIIVFDEATSSLDIETEKDVMQSILNLNKGLTIIIIAHRLSTIENCERVLRVHEGIISDDGRPKEIISKIKSKI